MAAVAAGGGGTAAVPDVAIRGAIPGGVEAISRQEAAEVAAGARPAAGTDAGEPAAAVDGDAGTAEALTEEAGRQRDNATMVIWGLILLQLAFTLYLGQLSSWWSVTGVLWLLVGYGVKERLSWALALPLVLFTLDVAMLLFGIGPRERAGFFVLAPMDFFLYLLRLVIWALIWSLRDELG